MRLKIAIAFPARATLVHKASETIATGFAQLRCVTVRR
jgi:hypothetical protein